jgi:DNA-binding response OmpR family regulator
MTKVCPQCLRPLPQADEISCDDVRGVVTFRGITIHLSRIRYQIFRLLWKRKTSVSREDIHTFLYINMPHDRDGHTIYAHMKYLRDKIKPLGLVIQTDHGYGYTLRIPDKE